SRASSLWRCEKFKQQIPSCINLIVGNECDLNISSGLGAIKDFREHQRKFTFVRFDMDAIYGIGRLIVVPWIGQKTVDFLDRHAKTPFSR
ncbi:hypothetical protein, partial [Ralstonia solanacearum]|uniref:hypothetical protein n=1 Tax=Ralstonia solanacearum TaxID=305 RepID=UPI001E61878B